MLTHWKKEANPNYLGTWDLIEGADDSGKPIYKQVNATISQVKRENIPDMEAIKKGKANAVKEELLIYFREFEHPMVIHAKANFKGLEKACATPFVERWIGKTVCVYVEEGVKAFGSVTDALRIKPAVKRLCSVCGKIVAEDIYNGSVSKYGAALCGKECLEKWKEKNTSKDASTKNQ